MVTIAIALSTGLMQSWLPHDHVKSLQVPSLSDFSSLNDKKKQAPITTSKPITISPEGATDFKKALEVCEYAMNVTNGDEMKDVINLRDRSPLIKNWVLAKQFCQSPIKNYGLSKNAAVSNSKSFITNGVRKSILKSFFNEIKLRNLER